MSRGMKSQMRRRDLLHKNKLQAFIEWVGKQPEFTICEIPVSSPFEVLRFTADGIKGMIILYQRIADSNKKGYDGATHISVPADCVKIVYRFLNEQKEANRLKHNNPPPKAIVCEHVYILEGHDPIMMYKCCKCGATDHE